MLHNNGANGWYPIEALCWMFFLHVYSGLDSQLLAPSQSIRKGKHCPLAVSAIKHHTQEALAILAVTASCLSPLLSSTVYESEQSPPHSISCHKEKWPPPGADTAQIKLAHNIDMHPVSSGSHGKEAAVPSPSFLNLSCYLPVSIPHGYISCCQCQVQSWEA